jgi:uncharacterized membrane protein
MIQSKGYLLIKMLAAKIIIVLLLQRKSYSKSIFRTKNPARAKNAANIDSAKRLHKQKQVKIWQTM